ncbi:MAG: hypothetical protein AAFV71_01760 [Cyanobacteria bacterium J06633_8]
MLNNLISANISSRVLTFQPGGSPASLEVIVINNSDRRASFLVEISAAGVPNHSNHLWYRLYPAVSAKKPPGDSTKFSIEIIDTPIPGFTGTMDITVRIFSLELPEEERKLFHLLIEEGNTSKPVKLQLPVQIFHQYPGEQLTIPLEVQNPNQKTAYVALNFLGIEPSWLIDGTQKNLQIAPGEEKELAFQCQLPTNITEAVCLVYPFTIEATHGEGIKSLIQGSLEILPWGFAEFRCHPQKQTIEERTRRFFIPTFHQQTYELELENQSNLSTSVNIEFRDDDKKKWDLQVEPEEVSLNPAETTTNTLYATSKKRRWFGFVKKLQLEAKAVFSDRRRYLRPETRSLEIRLKPIIPLWLQGGILLFLLYLPLIWLWESGHTDGVQSVEVISGSHDRTIRKWHFMNNFIAPSGLIAHTGKAVRVVRHVPSKHIIAAGLENGEIQLWDGKNVEWFKLFIRHKKPIASFTKNQNDRVLDLEFTKDSSYLFSSHGSGSVHMWDFDSQKLENTKLHKTFSCSQNIYQDIGKYKNICKKPYFAIYDIALVGNQNTNLVIGGQYNKLLLWNPNTNNLWAVSSGEGKNFNYIQSIATTPEKPNLVVTADNQGYIKLWDISSCKSKNNFKCGKIADEWSNAHGGKPVRSVALSKNGKYLASAGDDGRMMLWLLNDKTNLKNQDKYERESTCLSGKEIAKFSTKLNSISLFVHNKKKRILLVSGGDNNKVRLRGIKERDFLESC